MGLGTTALEDQQNCQTFSKSDQLKTRSAKWCEPFSSSWNAVWLWLLSQGVPRHETDNVTILLPVEGFGPQCSQLVVETSHGWSNHLDHLCRYPCWGSILRWYDRNQAVDRARNAQIASTSARTHRHTRYSGMSTITEWTQSVGFCASDAEATTSCQICDSSQNSSSCEEGVYSV